MKALCILLSAALIFHPCRAEQKKRVALTFDDGPHCRYTAEILKILYDCDIQATFFVVGGNAEKYPDLVRAEYDLGHEIGNHTYSHSVCDGTRCADIITEIKRTDEIIRDITGSVPALFRPPEGKLRGDILPALKRYGKKTVLWNVDTRDWAHTPVDRIIANVKQNVRDGSVILFHDYIASDSPTPEALRSVIPYLKSQGYEFVTVSGLLEAVEENGAPSSFFIG